MLRPTSRWRVLAASGAVCGLLVAGCDGDDVTERPAPAADDVSAEGSDTGSDASAGDPLPNACSLAADEITRLLDPPTDYLEKKVTPTPSKFDGDSICEWSSDGYSTELTLSVKPYDDYFHMETNGRPVEGLGEESWYDTKADSLYWRGGDYSISIHTGVTQEFSEPQLVDLAHAVDTGLPAE